MRVKAKSGATSSKKPRPFELVDFLLVYAHVERTRLKHAQHHPRGGSFVKACRLKDLHAQHHPRG
ncbi:MAG TPA: hypothetical protein VNZ53_58890 [Steroidobacteraceae bacterium]|nr:hypothetical protein [Steroidobacteraceae bacterium]